MPRRDDIEKILIIGSGPIVIGQACEFDYSGTQGCKVLRADGYKVVLVNSNPATIMTDPDMVDRTYIEPLTVLSLEQIIARERPDAMLPMLGGQTGLNLSVELDEAGVLEKYGVELIGVNADSIRCGENRELFKKAMTDIGLEMPKSDFCYSMDDAMRIIENIGFPAILRPSFTLGGTGSNIAYNMEEFHRFIQRGLAASRIHEVLIEESVIGWKEIEYEVMRDQADNCVVVCTIENFDPMGVHTGDSFAVAPAQTLTDKEVQIMRDASFAIMRRVGVSTGGSNIQFAVHVDTGRIVVIEMNPRVSRSSALASKATGFPIAKMAAKLAVGYTLDEIPNDITRKTPASFEPTIDYVVVKAPRWAFEKFPEANSTLTTQMKSVGETLAIGRTFKEAFQKSIRGLEIDRYGIGCDGKGKIEFEQAVNRLRIPNADRVFYVKSALDHGMSVDKLYDFTRIDHWYLNAIREIVNMEKQLKEYRGRIDEIPRELLYHAKQFGFSDYQLGYLWGLPEQEVRALRLHAGIRVTYKTVDTCAAEFDAVTPYYYSTYEEEDEAIRSPKKKIMILGGGPNRIGQGIEFDYCCCHAVFALSEDGYETIMVNSNPETVSTDYDTSDRLYFEPLTFEDVMNIVEAEKPEGVIVQFGGQTPLKLAVSLERAGVPIIGTSPDSIDLAEDRRRFGELLAGLGIRQPANGYATNLEEAQVAAKRIGYPVLVRPSYVLGGRAMEIVYDEASLYEYMKEAVQASPEHPVLIDKFLEKAVEIDVDAVADGNRCLIAGIMEHIEQAGVHSGDSACVLPPRSLSEDLIQTVRESTHRLAEILSVKGLMNVQYAVKDGELYVLEVNPRASRTVPFVSKVTGVPWAKVAARIMAGRTLDELGLFEEIHPDHYAVKEAVFPFDKFPNVDTILGPEMKSTGEVMGIDIDFGCAFFKSQIEAGNTLPLEGGVLISVDDRDKPDIVPVARGLSEMGFAILATNGTSKFLAEHGVETTSVYKVNENRPNVVDRIVNGEINFVINTPIGKESMYDERAIRRAAVANRVPICTTVRAAEAAVEGIHSVRSGEYLVQSLHEYHEALAAKTAK